MHERLKGYGLRRARGQSLARKRVPRARGKSNHAAMLESLVSLMSEQTQVEETNHVEESMKESSGRHRAAEWQAVLAELLGTLALTFVAAGGLMISEMTGQPSFAARVASPGILVSVMIYTLGQVSGAHINPAATPAFALRGAFPWARVPAYWLAQFTGAVLAILLLQELFGPLAHLGATLPHFGTWPSFFMEIILTCLLVMVITGTATESRLVGPNAGLAVGATVALCGLVGDPVSGASMNPARSLGPLLVSGQLNDAWIYIVAPALGAGLAVLLSTILHGGPDQHEAKAARGKANS